MHHGPKELSDRQETRVGRVKTDTPEQKKPETSKGWESSEKGAYSTVDKEQDLTGSSRKGQEVLRGPTLPLKIQCLIGWHKDYIRIQRCFHSLLLTGSGNCQLGNRDIKTGESPVLGHTPLTTVLGRWSSSVAQ